VSPSPGSRIGLRAFRFAAIGILVVFAVTALVELWMGRLPLGPDGRFGWLATDIWSSEQSQRVLDPYSFSHVIHGFAFYGFLWLVARKSPISARLVAAVALEGAWEILENSPLIIDRYRAVTIAQGYIGDSILNSASDLVMAAIGFLLAWRLSVMQSVGFIVATEILMVVLIRDNLTLNIVMLAFPIEAIRRWQMEGHEPG
jgi:hypothetical protein